MGGKRPLLLRAHWDWIVARIERQPDVPLRAVLAELHERGLKAGYHALWNLVRKARLSVKKKPAGQRARPPAGASNGKPGRVTLIRSGLSSLMKPGPRRTWRRGGGGPRWDSA
jgi:transposase